MKISYKFLGDNEPDHWSLNSVFTIGRTYEVSWDFENKQDIVTGDDGKEYKFYEGSPFWERVKIGKK